MSATATDAEEVLGAGEVEAGPLGGVGGLMTSDRRVLLPHVGQRSTLPVARPWRDSAGVSVG